jgi:hypothetical protein
MPAGTVIAFLLRLAARGRIAFRHLDLSSSLSDLNANLLISLKLCILLLTEICRNINGL